MQEVQANHQFGFEMFYRWKPSTISDSTYEFTLIFYRNCAGVTAGAPMNISLSTKATSINRTGSISTSRLPTTGSGVPSLEPPNLYNCTGSYNTLCIEEYVYRGDWTSPERAADWTFYYGLCCRPVTNAPDNIQNGMQYIECGLNNLDFPDTKAKNWSTIFHNRRPNHPGHLMDTIVNPFIKTMCEGQYYTLDQSAREYQGDSVTYNFFWPKTTGGNPITYINSWTFLNPLPVKNGSFVINPVTGVIPITAGSPSGTGIYVIGIESKEWRNDTIDSSGFTIIVPKQIGFNKRELIIWIDDTSSCRKDSVHIKDIYLDSLLVNNILQVHFQNDTNNQNSQVRCETLSPDGTEFRVLDSSTYVAPYDTTVKSIAVLGATWTCYAGLTNEVNLTLAEPLKCGDYYVILKKGSDLDVIQSECGFWEAEFSNARIYVDSIKPVSIGPDKTICKEKIYSIRLRADSGYTDYLWNTTQTTPIIYVRDPGKYWLQVRNIFECISTDTLYIIEKKCDTTNNDTTNTGVSEYSMRDVLVFPNPSSGLVNITLKDPDLINEIKLYNSYGTRLTSQSIEKSPDGYLWKLEGLSPGIYYLRISGKGGHSIVRKLIYSDP